MGGKLGWVGLKFLFLILLHFRVVRVGDRFYGERDEVYWGDELFRGEAVFADVLMMAQSESFSCRSS